MRELAKTKCGAGLIGVLAGLLLAAAAQANSGNVQIELNKLKSADNACRAFLVTQNLTEKRFKQLKLDVVMFNKKGIVAKRLAVGLGPLQPNKTSVKVFDIDKTHCEDLGQFLMNGVIACNTENSPVKNCASLLNVSARGSVSFIE
ncbi:hypothetical protein HKX42_07120 [Salinisphaera sp. USBA-960]|uniref:hypothetical protein n=1 Tax=Salinisphaera orenii TaxID=856731 RepID=UPI000DBE9B98|nr:hypothetical protein [Salifodinibacter halophilus]NNC26643.1 hypothetical protein [Salifodinibacter halophilus]